MSNRRPSPRSRLPSPPNGLFLLASLLTGAVTVLGLGAPRYLGAEPAVAIDADRRRAITEEVLASQRDPRGREEKIEALRAYERFIMDDLQGRSALKAEVIHRLGDLYTEIETATAARRRSDTRGRKGATPAPPPVRAKSIAVYERLLAQYPDRADNDGAWYQLARAYAEIGQSDESAKRLQHLRARYPKSPYVAEAAFRLGLRAFQARDFDAAMTLFDEARRGADPLLVESASYYLGWTALNGQEYRRGADAFLSILDAAAARLTAKSSAAERRGLPAPFVLSAFSDSEAAFLSDVVNASLLSFDYLGGPGELRAYLGHGPRRPYDELLYRTMGALYQAQDRTVDAVEAYRAFIAGSPLHPNAPVFQQAIVEVYTKAKWQSALIEAREHLVDRYGPDSAWARANGEAAQPIARPLIKRALYELAVYEHAQAQAKPAPEAYQRALTRHDRYLALFPKEVDAPKVAWLRADALFELGRYAEASSAYQHSAYDYPAHAQTREAGYAAVVAWERAFPADQGTPVNAAEGLLTRVNRFVAAFPDDARNPDLLMSAAEAAARAGLGENARAAATRLTSTYPTSRWTAAAHRLIGQSLYDQGDYPGAEQAFRRALAGATGAQAEAVAALAASALYQTGAARRTAGDREGAEAAYVKVATDFPSTALAPAALHEAADSSRAAGDLDKATGLWSRLAKDYPNAPQTPPALRRLAETAVGKGEPLRAIEWYERLAARSDPPTQTALTWTIADLAEQARVWPRAAAAFSTLAARADLPPAETIEAGFRAAKAVAEQGKAAEARQLTDAMVSRYRTWRGQRGALDELTVADTLAAEALMETADSRAATAEAIRLRHPLEDTLAQKQAAVNAALDAYAEAAAVKAPATTAAATHRIGVVLDEFFEAILSSERPGDLTPEQLEQYDFLLEEQAAPFEERAVTAYETNVRRTHELGTYDDWTRRSFERLAVLRPARYQRPEQDEMIRREWEPLP